jgi:hypothetical protein
MKSIPKIISAFIFIAFLGSYDVKAQGCTIVLKPNALTQGNLFIDQVIQLSTAVNKCNTAGNITSIVIKYHNSFYKNNSPALQNIQINIGEANNAVIALTASQNSTVKGAPIAGPAQSYTETLTYMGDNARKYLPTDQYIEFKAFAYAGGTTSDATLSNWIDEIDIVTAP